MLLINSNMLFSALFEDIGINVGFNTFRLLGDNLSTQPQLPFPGNMSGGGLNYIEPGFDISATLFLDKNDVHRLIAGIEYIAMNAKEVVANKAYAYFYAHHYVNFIDAFCGYHYSFYKAPWQNVRIYSGLELMFNNTILNELEWGQKALKNATPPSDFYEEKVFYNKSDKFRIGGRIRLGFEGRVKDNIYIGASGTLGIYNLYKQNDKTGELFNFQNIYDKTESFQPFFNFLISMQYRFNDKN